VDQLGIPSQTNFFTALLRSAQRRPGEMPWSRPVSPPFNFLLLPVIASTVGTAIEWYDFFLYAPSPVSSLPSCSSRTRTLGSERWWPRDLGRWLRRAAGGHYGDRIGRKSTLIATLLLRGGGGHDRCVGFRLCCCRVRFTHAYRGDDARLRFETQLVGARCPFAPFPVLCTADEWNRNTPAVHRSGRSAKLPGGFVRHKTAHRPNTRHWAMQAGRAREEKLKLRPL
jgi:hypothetical protein